MDEPLSTRDVTGLLEVMAKHLGSFVSLRFRGGGGCAEGLSVARSVGLWSSKPLDFRRSRAKVAFTALCRLGATQVQ